MGEEEDEDEDNDDDEDEHVSVHAVAPPPVTPVARSSACAATSAAKRPSAS
jgi:hypothetical protein